MVQGECVAGTRLIFGVLLVSLMTTACGGFGSLPFRGSRKPAPVTTAVPATPPAPAAAVVPEAVVEVVPAPAAPVMAAESADDLAAPVVESTPAPPAWDIEVAPYESNERVAYFVSRFSGPMRPTFEVALARQSRYAPLIHARLRSAGLPEDMIYLPLIESWYDPHAYSRAAAVGMWQFMTTTAKGVGLRVDWWVDERRDPVRATDGAVAHLVELRDSFGSMYLAAAAYNGGSGRVSRGLAKHASRLEGVEGEDLFFALADEKALRAETADYVPKLIAAALVGKDPARYGVTIAPVEPFAWDSVRVPPATPLAAVAKALAVPLDTVMDYNPHMLRGMTPPVGVAVYLRVPVGAAEDFGARFGALSESERSAVKRVLTKAGDYMTKIAKANGLTAKQLNMYNPQATRLKNGNLTAGQRILVPRMDVVRAARDVPDPKIERYGTSATGSHVVKKGESLSVIAKRNGTTVAAIKRLNRLKSDRIRVGQKLRVR